MKLMAQGRYAARTEVPVSRSEEEIESTLVRYGARAFFKSTGWDASTGQEVVTVRFELHRMPIQLRVSYPARKAPRGRDEEFEQTRRQRWRAMNLYVKAACEAVDARILTLEEAFLGHILLPDGDTFGDLARPQIAGMLERGQITPLLIGPRTTGNGA